jgi:hypothetical protein
VPLEALKVPGVKRSTCQTPTPAPFLPNSATRSAFSLPCNGPVTGRNRLVAAIQVGKVSTDFSNRQWIMNRQGKPSPLHFLRVIKQTQSRMALLIVPVGVTANRRSSNWAASNLRAIGFRARPWLLALYRRAQTYSSRR